MTIHGSLLVSSPIGTLKEIKHCLQFRFCIFPNNAVFFSLTEFGHEGHSVSAPSPGTDCPVSLNCGGLKHRPTRLPVKYSILDPVQKIPYRPRCPLHGACVKQPKKNNQGLIENTEWSSRCAYLLEEGRGAGCVARVKTARGVNEISPNGSQECVQR